MGTWADADDVGDEFTFTDDDSVQKDYAITSTSDSSWSQMNCFATRTFEIESAEVDDLVAGEMSYSAGARVWTDSSDSSGSGAGAPAWTSDKPDSLYTFDVVDGAASLAAAATAVAISLAL